MSFSKRFGHIPNEKEIQLESMDDDLRNSLWNSVHVCYLSSNSTFLSQSAIKGLALDLWANHFKRPIDQITGRVYASQVKDSIKKKFFSYEWNEVYDFLEFLVQRDPTYGTSEDFIGDCNRVLEREFAGYRFIGKTISKITSKEEMAEIKDAIESGIDSVRAHISTSISMLSDRKSPDYRNSIKESISAVESICKIISEEPNATMTQALNQIEKSGKIQLHTDMKDAFQKMYWYASDGAGIRHSLMEGKIGPDFDDAKFMMVSCSAIVNYLISKANKSQIKFKSRE